MTLIVMLSAGLSSYYIYRERTLDELFRTMDKSMDELELSIREAVHKEELFDLSDYVKPIYEEEPDATEGLTGEELLQKCRKEYGNLYYNETGMIGLAQISLRLRQDYFALSGIIDKSVITPGVTNSFIAFWDEERNRLVYLVDSLYGLDDKITDVTVFPGAFYELNESDHPIHVAASKYDEYALNGKYYKYVDIGYPINEGTEDETESYLATIFIEYDIGYAKAEIQSFLHTELIAMSIATVVLIVLFELLAHFFLVKNVSRLNKSAMTFTEKMTSESDLAVVDPKIRAKDEIGVLSGSFLTMQEGIISYADKIKADAKERERMDAELSIAREIQLEALPDPRYQDDFVRLFSDIASAKEVGGDFYDYFYIDEKRFAVVIADVTGKGIPAALFMMRTKGLLKTRLQTTRDLKQTLFDVNNELMENNKAGLFVTAFVGVVDKTDGVMQCVSAGHERPYMIGDGKVERLAVRPNFVLGGIKDFRFSVETFDLTDKRLFLFTDGLNEAINDDNEEFGYERIVRSLLSTAEASSEDVLSGMKKDLATFTGEKEPFDDVTMLLLDTPVLRFSKTWQDPDFSAIDEAVAGFNGVFTFLDERVKGEFDVIFDEVMNNLVSYEKVSSAFFITVDARKKGDSISLVFRSNGAPFDPLSVEEKHAPTPDGPMGGFGITIVKSLCNRVSYERVDEKNVLIIEKSLPKS